jgi:hypothetical protein
VADIRECVFRTIWMELRALGGGELQWPFEPFPSCDHPALARRFSADLLVVPLLRSTPGSMQLARLVVESIAAVPEVPGVEGIDANDAATAAMLRLLGISGIALESSPEFSPRDDANWREVSDWAGSVYCLAVPHLKSSARELLADRCDYLLRGLTLQLMHIRNVSAARLLRWLSILPLSAYQKMMFANALEWLKMQSRGQDSEVMTQLFLAEQWKS